MAKIDLNVLKELKTIKEMIQDGQKRLSDYTSVKAESLSEKNTDCENALIELDEEIHEEFADIENALCELTTE